MRVSRLSCAVVMAVLLPAGAVARTPSSSDPTAEVRLSGGRITVRASGAPVSRVLERIAEVTGMSLSFTDGRPADPVSLMLDDVNPAEAITRILEGLGVDYALGTSADGSRINVLVVTGRGPQASARPDRAAAAAVQAGPSRTEAEKNRTSPRPPELEADPASPSEPPRPSGVELPRAAHPPLPARPSDLPTSPFVPYYGSLNPDGPAPDPEALPIEPPSPGDVVDMDGMGPDGVPATERKSRLPEVSPAPPIAPPPPSKISVPVPPPTP
jgi:hypothetical protein